MPLIPLLLLLAGCPTAEAPPGAEPAVELGTGELDFEPLQDGDRLAIILGPQGGYHLLGSLRTQGIVAGDASSLTDPTNPTMTFDVIHNGESICIVPPFTQGLQAAPEEQLPWTHWMLGRQARLDLALGEGVTLDGEEVDFSIRVEDTDGAVVEDTVHLVLFPHPLNSACVR